MEAHTSPYLLHFIVGAVIVSTFLLRHFFRQVNIPELVGFILLGLLLAGIDAQFNAIKAGGDKVFEFLGNVGLIVLLFRTGLESDSSRLREELGPAGVIWVGNFLLSGLAGFLTAFYLLHLGLVTSLVIGTAFTATSIAISVGIWRESDMLKRRESNLLLNVAQMDDVSGVAALALVVALIPMLESEASLDGGAIASAMTTFIAGFFVFSIGCLLFARYLEAPITDFFIRIARTDSCLMLLTAGSGVMIAAVAEGLGLSLAVGALFAGLVFSKNPRAEHIDEMLIPIYNLFAPFFFIAVGMAIEPSLFMAGIEIGGILLIPAVLGKVFGGALPSLRYLQAPAAWAVGISLVPRAEIMLVIAGTARSMGPGVLPDEVFAALVFVSAVTCVLTPPAVRPLLARIT